MMTSMSRTGDVANNSMVPVRFSSAKSRIVIIGMKNSPITLTFDNSGRIMYSLRFTGNVWPLIWASMFESQSSPANSRRRTRRSPRTWSAADKRWVKRNSCGAPCGRLSRYFSLLCSLGCEFLRFRRSFLSSQLQEDLLQAHSRGAQLIQIPAGLDHGTSEIAAHEILLAFDLKNIAAVAALF